jgi:DNA modification methylase
LREGRIQLIACLPKPANWLPEPEALLGFDWDFADRSATDDSYTHEFHPYPAKFVREIPALVLENFSQPGSTVLDPFAGSGTTLVEGLVRGCEVIGIDGNPVAALVTAAKTATHIPSQEAIERVSNEAMRLAAHYYAVGDFDPFYVSEANRLAGKRFSGVAFWFSREAQLELSALRRAIDCEEGVFRIQALASLSAIVTRVSYQDSDTRYVRRLKSFRPLQTIEWFKTRLVKLRDGLEEMGRLRGSACAQVFLGDSRNLEAMNLPKIDLVVTSTPYPNAYSYHLYHQLRAIWLGFSLHGLREGEIGNHRDYSRRNGADEGTFQKDMARTFVGLRSILKPTSVVVFVIGNSIIRGERVDNVEVLRRAALQAGLLWVGSKMRRIDPRKKSFNPRIGKIKTETVCVMSPA